MFSRTNIVWTFISGSIGWVSKWFVTDLRKPFLSALSHQPRWVHPSNISPRLWYLNITNKKHNRTYPPLTPPPQNKNKLINIKYQIINPLTKWCLEDDFWSFFFHLVSFWGFEPGKLPVMLPALPVMFWWVPRQFKTKGYIYIAGPRPGGVYIHKKEQVKLKRTRIQVKGVEKKLVSSYSFNSLEENKAKRKQNSTTSFGDTASNCVHQPLPLLVMEKWYE